MKRVALSALIVVALAVLITPAAAQETLQPGRTEGALETSTAEYALNAAAGQVFVIGASSPDFDPYIYVFGEDKSISLVADNDSGAGQNALAVFTAPADGTYSVEVLSSRGNATGAYTIDLITDFPQLQVGTPLPVSVADGAIQVFRFQSAGGPHDVGVSSSDAIGTSLALVTSYNFLVGSVDSSSVDPQIERAMLPADTYYVVVQPNDATVAGDIELLVETSTLPSLNDGPATFTFDADKREDIVTLDVVQGTLYEIAVTSSVAGRVSLSFQLPEANGFSKASFSYDNGEGGIFLYRPDVTSSMNVKVSSSFNQDRALDVTVTVTEVTEE